MKSNKNLNIIDLSTISEVKLTYLSKIKPSERPKVSHSYDAFKLFLEHWDDSISYVESMKIILLNRANKVLGIANLSSGGTNGCLIDLKVVFQYAIKANASSIILAHNHPSGNMNPSEADLTITKKVRDAGKLLDISLLDHLILTTEEEYCSMADERYI